MDLAETIANNIRALLAARKESAFQAATAAGLGRTAIDDYLRGRSKSLKVETLETLATYFGVSIHSLMDPRSDDQLRQAIIDTASSLSDEDKEKFLRVAQAMKGGTL